ncbi:MAG: hypothetical protein JW995_06920 [Melioribacteraceae bacterium]|nr:hypothetical protein [Melioribacteraceae bacterium]
MSKLRILVKFLFFYNFLLINAQIKLIELPPFDNSKNNANQFNFSEIRQIIPLESGWKAYTEDSEDNTTSVNLPCVFKNAERIIFEKEFSLSENVVKSKELFLIVEGLNYSAEVLLNDIVIFKNDVASIPFEVHLVRELLKTKEPNNLKIIVSYELDDETTIPPVQRFLFPENIGGIAQSVSIEVLPLKRIYVQNLKTTLNEKNVGNLSFNISLINNSQQLDSISAQNLRLTISLINSNGAVVLTKEIKPEGKNHFNNNLSISNITQWNPKAPYEYILKIELLSDGNVVDEINRKVIFYSIEFTDSGLKFNHDQFSIKGIVYIPDNRLDTYKSYREQIFSDLEFIKGMGFNSVRFAKHIPAKSVIHKCQELGLLVFAELPVYSLPEQFAIKEDYIYRVNSLLNKFLSEYSSLGPVAAIGLGISYIPDSPIHAEFLSGMSKKIKNYSGKLTYASFSAKNSLDIKYLDLYGIELFKENLENELNGVDKNDFLSEVTYPNFRGTRSGYLDQNSTEAQAKYFEDLINISQNKSMSGFFINSFSNYSGEYTSIVTKFNEENQYQIGIIDDNKNPSSITYKVINSKLTNKERVTIPIGSATDDSPIFIIFTGLFLAIVMGVLINSKKKFREDATRALLRPYNFYSDIRDQRILSGFHTIVLMFVLAASHALLLTNLFFYFKSSVLTEKLLITFAQPFFTKAFSYLAWDPVSSFIYGFIFTLAVFLIIALVIKMASFFVKTKVHYSNIYFVVVWAFLPLALLLPVKIVLYRVLEAHIINLYIFIFLILYFIWILQRILKGVYVIFDTSKTAVYFYSLLFFTVLAGSVILWFQLKHSTVYYIITTLKQFQLF